MLCRLIVLVLFCTTLILATRVQINNYCPQQLFIIEITSDGTRTNPLCKLPSGFSCYNDYTEASNRFRLQNGYAYNVTAVVIDIFPGDNDGYDIRTVPGFDLPAQVSSSNGGPTFICTDPKCPDSYSLDNTKIGIVKSGGVITINFCPYNMEAFATKGLQLVETIQKPFATNPKHKPAIAGLKVNKKV